MFRFFVANVALKLRSNATLEPNVPIEGVRSRIDVSASRAKVARVLISTW